NFILALHILLSIYNFSGLIHNLSLVGYCFPSIGRFLLNPISLILVDVDILDQTWSPKTKAIIMP
ncbi:hypothetical protein ACJX0J_024685, partial [Zea mays]